MSHIEYYLIKTNYAHYIVKVEDITDYFRLHFGSKKKCIVIDVYNDDDVPQISGVNTNENCNVAGDMKRGDGTIHMLRTCMKFVLHRFHHKPIIQFRLKDTSFIEGKRNVVISLAKLYMFHHNATWYESNFTAECLLEDPKTYRNQKRSLKKAMAQGKPNFNDLFASVPEKVRKYLKNAYESCDTMMNFSEMLQRNKVDCFYYQTWLDKYVNHYVPNLTGSEWIIHVEKSGCLNIDITTERIASAPEDLFTIRGGDVWGNFGPMGPDL